MRRFPLKGASRIALAAGLVVSTLSLEVHPQPDDSGESTAPAITPPKLTHFEPAPFPKGEDVPEDGEKPQVLLSLTVGVDGSVAAVEVLTGYGAAFDEAAVAAAKQFQFEPAKRGDEAVAVKIRYAYVFELPAPEPAAAPPVAAPKQPVKKEDEKPSQPVPAPAPAAAEAEEEIPEFSATAEVEAPPREVTKRTLKADKLLRMPGTNNDPLRAVEVLPGVARSDGDEPILRGAAWNESQVFLEGARVPLLYHFGGVKSFFQGRLLDRIDYYPGNFSVRYGRVAGGIIDIKVRDAKQDRLHGMLDLSLLDSSVMLETPVGDNAGIAFAARRSNIDFVFEQFVPKDAYSVVAAPVYWDYQLLTHWQLDRKHRLSLLSYGSRDEINLVFSEPVEEDPTLRNGVRGGLEFHNVQLALESELSEEVRQELALTYGHNIAMQRFGPLYARFIEHSIMGRGEWIVRAAEAIDVTVGLDVQNGYIDGTYLGPRPPQNEGDPRANGTLASYNNVYVERKIWSINPAGYVELSIRPTEKLELIPGVRADYFGDFDAWSVDPRIAARYALTSTTTLKAGVGKFTQAPEYYLAIPEVGNDDLEPYYAIQTSAGVEQRIEGDGPGSADVQLGVEGFYKQLENRIVSTEDGAEPYLINDGDGRIYGFEAAASFEVGSRSFGYLSYTLSRSERRDRGGPYRLFDQDQTHILNLAATHRLGAGWEVGARFRLTSGNPETPVTGATFDATSGQYVPQFGRVNSDRQPLNHRLDLNVEKKWQFTDWSLSAYLNILNAYNAQTREGTRYSYDYSTTESAAGLPFFPNLGIRGEL